MTFSEVVQNTTSPNAPDYFLVGGAIIKENSSWRSNSLLGELRQKTTIPIIHGLCEGCGLSHAKIAEMGGNYVLISFFDLEAA